MKTVPAGEFKQACLRLFDEVGESGEPEDWLGTMRDRGEIRGDLIAPAVKPDEWHALRG